jgi:hypothetical protein
MKNNIVKAAVLASLLTLSAGASATVLYDYNRGAGSFGGNSGLSYDSINATFDTGTEEFSFTVDYNGAAADGGWLVVSPGANPKHANDELAIAYFDADSGDVWAYAYNGNNNNHSYQETQFLGYHAGAYTTTGDIATLILDATYANAQTDTGFAFGEDIGVWFHPSANTTAIGDANGLNSFVTSSVGWFDVSNDGDCANQNTGCVVQVAEPGSLLLVGLGFGAMGLRRRLRNV